MKKTVSLLLAVLIAAIGMCTFATSAFADETTTAANDDPTDSWATTEAPTTAAPTTAATTAAPTTAAPTTAATTAATTTEPVAGTTVTTAATTAGTTAEDKVVTRAPGQTVIDEGETKPTTTKKPAKVDTDIPSTGSSIVVPAIALLALATGTVAVIKTKKED